MSRANSKERRPDGRGSWARVCGAVWALAWVVALAGCQSTERSGAVAPAASVKPGINAEYLKADIQVTNWVERFEREGREIFDHREEIVRAAGVRPGMEMADIGCGTGLFVPMFAAATGESGRVYAVDIVGEFLKLVDRRMEEAGVRNVRTVLCSERSVELFARSIDLAFLCDVYHHFEYPSESLASIHQALRRGGELVVIDFKRIPGVSSDWVLNHVRAGQEVVTAEIEAAGFVKVEELPLLKDNYMLRFRKGRPGLRSQGR